MTVLQIAIGVGLSITIAAIGIVLAFRDDLG